MHPLYIHSAKTLQCKRITLHEISLTIVPFGLKESCAVDILHLSFQLHACLVFIAAVHVKTCSTALIDSTVYESKGDGSADQRCQCFCIFYPITYELS